MAVWKTASEIERMYLVGASALEAYGRRGNLAFRRCDNGELLYEEGGVARLFRARGGGMTVSAEAAARPGFGLLGAARLGQAPAPMRTSSRHEIRARAYQAARDIVDRARKAG
jgi:hypothetical protein